MARIEAKVLADEGGIWIPVCIDLVDGGVPWPVSHGGAVVEGGTCIRGDGQHDVDQARRELAAALWAERIKGATDLARGRRHELRMEFMLIRRRCVGTGEEPRA